MTFHMDKYPHCFCYLNKSPPTHEYVSAASKSLRVGKGSSGPSMFGPTCQGFWIWGAPPSAWVSIHCAQMIDIF